MNLKTMAWAGVLGAALVMTACSGSNDDTTTAQAPVETVPPVTAPGPGASAPDTTPQPGPPASAPTDTPPDPQPPTGAPDPNPVTPPPVVVPPSQPPQPTPTPSAGKTVPMFAAIGHVGRTTISCDGGRSWVANRSDNDAIRCFARDANGANCDESKLRGMGVNFGNGAFVATWGWGDPDGLYRSTDGVNWPRVLGGTTMAGIEFRNNRFVAVDGSLVQLSDDAGVTWKRGTARGTDSPSDQIVRGMGSTNVPEASFFAVAIVEQDGGPQKMKFSADGITWKRPVQFPDDICTGGSHFLGVAEHHGIIAIAHSTGVCRSADKAQNWTNTAVPGTITGKILSDGSRFIAWGRDTRNRPAAFTSADGLTWTATPTQVRSPAGQLSAGPTNPLDLAAAFGGGVYVAVANSDDFPPVYDDQQFLRSTDGITWDALPASNFVKSHPMRFIAFGEASPSSVCPGP